MFEARQGDRPGKVTFAASGGYDRNGEIGETTVDFDEPELRVFPYCIWFATETTNSYSRITAHVVIANYKGLGETPEALFNNTIVTEIDFSIMQTVAEYEVLGKPKMPDAQEMLTATSINREGDFVPFLTMDPKDSIAEVMFSEDEEQ